MSGISALLHLEDRVSRVELELARMRHAEPDSDPEIGPRENLVPFLGGEDESRERTRRRKRSPARLGLGGADSEASTFGDQLRNLLAPAGQRMRLSPSEAPSERR